MNFDRFCPQSSLGWQCETWYIVVYHIFHSLQLIRTWRIWTSVYFLPVHVLDIGFWISSHKLHGP